MTGPGTEDETLTAAAGNVPASELPGGGRGRVPGSDSAPEAHQVRHLVIFRAPVAGFCPTACRGLRAWRVVGRPH